MKRFQAFLVLAAILLTCFSGNSYAVDEPEYLPFAKKSLNLIGLNELQDRGLKGKDQVVVVIDEGLEVDHPALKDAVISGFCSSKVTCGSNFMKESIQAGSIPLGSGFSHGMMVSGIIAGRPTGYFPGGIAPEAKLISINNTGGNDPGLLIALDWILEAKKKYNIVAVSGSFATANVGARDDALACNGNQEIALKVASLVDAGIVPVFATGNDGNPYRVNFPACLHNVISVGATDANGNIQPYSNVGKGLTVLAPSDVMTTSVGRTYSLGSGTSAAAPVVAGAVALLKQAKPTASFEDVRKALSTSINKKNDAIWKDIPILNLTAALDAIAPGLLENPVSKSDSSLQVIPETQSQGTPVMRISPSGQMEAAKKVTLICTKGKIKKTIVGLNPNCPTGFSKKK